jgi:hypothetical protein
MVDMVAMRDLWVIAIIVITRACDLFAISRIGPCDCDYMLIVMLLVEEVEVSIVEIVGMALMLNLCVTALRTVLVCMG